MTTYRIRDWDAHFETTESRKVKNARWVPVPNKQDGKGYRRIAVHKNNVNIFCAWNLMLQVASKMPVRGVLADHDGPLDAEDLAFKTGFPARIFEQAFEVLCDPRVGWVVQDDGKPENLPAPAAIPAEPEGIAATTRAEGKGREGNNKEGKDKKKEEECPPSKNPVIEVFEYWQTQMKHPKAQLTPDRRKRIVERLADSTLEEIKAAIRGCKLSDFHMGREPDKPKVFDDIELICRRRSKLEDFIAIEEREADDTNHKQKPANAQQRDTFNIRESLSYLQNLRTERENRQADPEEPAGLLSS